jgi:hypothetical protein
MGHLPRGCRTDLKKQRLSISYFVGRCRFLLAAIDLLLRAVPAIARRRDPFSASGIELAAGEKTHEQIGPKRGIARRLQAALQACENSFSTPRPENIANLPCAGTTSTIQILERKPGEMCELLHTRADKEAYPFGPEIY